MDAITVTPAELEPDHTYAPEELLDAPISVTDEEISHTYQYLSSYDKSRRERRITDKQLRFAMEYIANGNDHVAAAKSAGVKPSDAKGWVTPLKRDSTFHQLWSVIRDAQKRRLTHLDATRERVLTELARIAFFDPKTMYDPDTGDMLPIKDMPEDTRRAIGGIDITTNAQGFESVKVKIIDKTNSLKQLASILGISKETLVVEHKFEDLLKEIQGHAPKDPLVIDCVNEDDPLIFAVPEADLQSKELPL